MENNKVKDNENLVEQKLDIEVMRDKNSLDEVEHVNQMLTNEQKLEYLSKLIQDVDQNLETNGISKELGR